MNNSNDLFALLLARTKSGGGGGGGGSDDYRDLSHKPQINNHTLNGSMTSADLGITSANDTTITVKVTGENDQTFTTNQSSASNITVNVPVRDVTVGGTSALDTSTHTVALGSAAGSATTDFATSAQGGKADSAVQTLTINNSATGVTKTGDAVDISAVPATIVSAGKLANNMEATTQSASDNSDKLATTKYVDTAVGNLPKPMVYTGAITLTADSTDTTKASITVTAPASASNIKEGFTYKVATIASSPAYTGTLKVGDTFIAAKNAPTVSASWVADTDWNVIPSGDEPSGTVIQVSTGAGLTGGPVTTSGTIKANLQSETAFGGAAASVTPGSITTNIQPVLTDSNGKLAVKVDKSDVGLGNVTNDAQVKKISSSVNNNIVKWGGTDGATVADSGVSISTSVADNDTTVPTGKAVTTELNKKQNILTAGAGLAFGTGADANKLGHSNSVTAKTTSSVKKFTYDAYGHVTGSSELSTAESDALASGIDSTKVEQINTNQTNIGKVQTQALIAADQSTQYNVSSLSSFSGTSGYSATQYFIPKIAAGTYRLICNAALTDTSQECQFQIGDNEFVHNIALMPLIRNGKYISNEFTVNYELTSIRVYCNTPTSITNMAIIPKSLYDAGFTDYQPYALPNTKITPELIELVDSGAKNLVNSTSGTGTRWIDIPVDIPAGEYAVSFATLSTTWEVEANQLQVSFFDSNYDLVTDSYTYIDCTTKNGVYKLNDTCKVIRLYASPTSISGKVVTYTNMMLCSKAAWDVSQKFVPYRPSYEETVEQVSTNKNNILTANAELIELVDNGAKNLFLPTAESKTNPTGFTGTITNNGDGSYTINGTAGSSPYYLKLGTINLKAGNYVLYARPTQQSGFYVYNDGAWTDSDVNDNRYATFATDTTQNIYLRADSNATVSNYTIYPMICYKSAWDVSQKYVPYAMTNAEITAWIQAHT